MSDTPRTWFAGKSAPEDRKGLNPSTITVLVTFLLSPMGVATAVLGYYLAFSMARLSWKVIAGSTGIYGLLWLLLGGARQSAIAAYFTPWRDIIRAFRDGTIGATLSSEWPSWLLAQAPLSLLLGGIGATAFSYWKWFRRPSWEPNDRAPGPLDILRRKRTISAIRADVDGPNNGITLGYTQHGHRVVQLDDEAAGHTFVAGGSGSGKALDVETPIPTPAGWKQMGDLQVGDLVFDEQGQPTEVMGAYDVQYDRPCYEVVFSDGSTIVADGEHLWLTDTVASRKSANRARPRRPVGSDRERIAASEALAAARGQVTIRDIQAILEWPKSRRSTLHTWLKAVPVVDTVHVGPYRAVYGDKTVQRTSGAPSARYDARAAWLAVSARLEAAPNGQRGNGATASVVTTEQIRATLRDDIGKAQHSVRLVGAPVRYPVRDDLPLAPYLLGLWLGDGATAGAKFTTADPELLTPWLDAGYKVKHVAAYDYSISGGLHVTLREMGVAGNKHIPAPYLTASESQRRALLAGLLDSDGHNEPGAAVAFSNKNRVLAEQVRELAASLGYRPTITSRFIQRDSRRLGPYYVVRFPAPDSDVFWLPRKRDEQRAGRQTASVARQAHRYIVDVRPVESRPVRCIKVASPHSLFLAGKTFIPTHNTTTMMIGIRDAIRRREPVMFIDLKGAADVPEQLADWAARYNRRFLHWTIQNPREPYQGPADGPAFYDPIGRGDPSRRKDLLIGSQKWDVEYYKTVVANYLQIAFQVADRNPRPDVDSFSDVADLLNWQTLRDRALALTRDDSIYDAEGLAALRAFHAAQRTRNQQGHAPKSESNSTSDWDQTLNGRRLPAKAHEQMLRDEEAVGGNSDGVPWEKKIDIIVDPDLRDLIRAVLQTTDGLGDNETELSAIRNMRARLQTLTRSTAGYWLRKSPNGERNIDLRRVVDEGWVVVISLDSSNYEETSKQIGGLMIQDLKTLSSELRHDPAPTPFHVYIDEFSAIGSDNVLGLLARARDALMPVTLSTQAIADLTRADPSFPKQVMGIISSFVIHRANLGEDAEIFAELTGEHTVYRKQYGIEMTSGMPGGVGTGAATGSGFIREDQETQIKASEFQALKRGELIYIAKSPEERLERKVFVQMEDPAAVTAAIAAGAVPAGRPRSTGPVALPSAAAALPDGMDAPLPAQRPTPPTSGAAQPSPAATPTPTPQQGIRRPVVPEVDLAAPVQRPTEAASAVPSVPDAPAAQPVETPVESHPAPHPGIPVIDPAAFRSRDTGVGVEDVAVPLPQVTRPPVPSGRGSAPNTSASARTALPSQPQAAAPRPAAGGLPVVRPARLTAPWITGADTATDEFGNALPTPTVSDEAEDDSQSAFGLPGAPVTPAPVVEPTDASDEPGVDPAVTSSAPGPAHSTERPNVPNKDVTGSGSSGAVIYDEREWA